MLLVLVSLPVVGTIPPMELNLQLTSWKYGEHLNMNKDDAPLDYVFLYRILVGKLQYLSITRQDISFEIQNLS